MRKLNFIDPLSKAFDVIDENILEFKSGVVGLITGIERFFGQTLGVSLTAKKPINIDKAFCTYFPSLAKITPLQFEQLRNVYCKINNINTHLFVSLNVKIPNELEEFFNSFPTPPYDIVVDGELTVYGMIFVLNFFSQKSQISSFISEYFQSTYFYCFIKRETSEIQTSSVRYFVQLCGKGKVTFNEKYPFCVEDAELFNASYKKYLIKIFLGIEKCVLKWTLSSKKMLLFHYLLLQNKPFSKDYRLSVELIKLRKNVFHGVSLFDEFKVDGERLTFSFDYFIPILIRLKKLLTGVSGYEYVLQLIDELGEKLVQFFLSRMIEESYKILDKRLFNEQKINSKIETLNKFTKRLENIGKENFEMAVQLIGKEEISYSVNTSRFADLMPRETKTDLLKIVKIKSNNNIKIGDYALDGNQLCFALVDVERENLNTINGVLPLDLDLEIEEFYSSKIGVCKTIELN